MASRWIKVGIAALALSAVLLSGCGTREESATAEGEAREEEAVASGAVGTVEGMLPPPFELADLEGNEVSLSDFEGSVVVLDLWATWCPPCRLEIPFLVSMYEELKDQGLVVVGVGLDQGGAPVLKPFAEENGITYPILVGDRSIQAAYGVTAIPTTFMIGRDGRVAGKHVGFHPSMAEEMRADVERLLAAGAEGA